MDEPRTPETNAGGEIARGVSELRGLVTTMDRLADESQVGDVSEELQAFSVLLRKNVERMEAESAALSEAA